MKHLPSIEALTDADDTRLAAELEIRRVLEKLARVRAFVDRADRLLATVLAGGDATREALPLDRSAAAEIFAALRKP